MTSETKIEILTQEQFKQKYGDTLISEYNQSFCGGWVSYSLVDDMSYIAVVSNHIAGMIIWGVVNPDTRSNLVYIDRLCVNPEYENKGIGSKLVETVLDNLPNTIKYVMLEPTDVAVSLYKRLGFKFVEPGASKLWPEWAEARQKKNDVKLSREDRLKNREIEAQFSRISSAFRKGMILEVKPKELIVTAGPSVDGIHGETMVVLSIPPLS